MTQQSLLPEGINLHEGRPNGHALLHVRYDAGGKAVEHALFRDTTTLDDKGMAMLEVIEQTYSSKTSSMVRAAVAAVMEAGMLTEISIHVDTQATIWDRYELAASFDEATKCVTYTLIEKQTI